MWNKFVQLFKFKITGLTCEACIKLITLRLKKIIGVTEISIDLQSGQAEVRVEPDLSFDRIEQVFVGTDYSITKL
ncbi:MAG: Copper-translocating P-type ATPase [Parcubacteria group bacterium GW2011_GWA2_36_10]|nr:MAG: Copper-translocating P-type ATPase [Parcubacteria group bacterium GW2011_GWA2_36_10]